MSTPVISGDSIFSHVFIGAADVQKSAAFYDVTLGALGIKNLGPFGNGWVLFGREKPAFIIAQPGNGEAPSSNGVTIGFAAATPAEVDAFHAAGLAAGGTDEGQPGPRGHRFGVAEPDLATPLHGLTWNEGDLHCEKHTEFSTYLWCASLGPVTGEPCGENPFMHGFGFVA